MNSLAYRHLQEPHISNGTSIYSAIVQLSSCFGIAIAAVSMMGILGHHITDIYHIPLHVFKLIYTVQSIYLIGAAFVFFQINQQEGKADVLHQSVTSS